MFKWLSWQLLQCLMAGMFAWMFQRMLQKIMQPINALQSTSELRLDAIKALDDTLFPSLALPRERPMQLAVVPEKLSQSRGHCQGIFDLAFLRPSQ